MQTIGKKIKELRKSKKITQEALSYELGVSRQTVHKWERDDARPGTDNLKALCEFFKVSSEYFINENVAIEEVAVVDGGTMSEDSAIADNRQKRKTKTYLIVCAIVIIIVSLALVCSVSFTVGIGFIVFTDNFGYEKISLLEVEKYTFNLFLILSLILTAIDLVMIFYVKKMIK